MSPVPCVITDPGRGSGSSPQRGSQHQPTAGVPAPRREAGPPRCPTVPHFQPQPVFQPSEPPSHHIPTPRSSPPRRSHQTGLKVNNSLPRPGAGSGQEWPRWGVRGGRGRRAEPQKQRRAVEAMPVARTVGDGPPAPPPSPELCQSPQIYYSPASPSLGVLSSTSHARCCGACAVPCRGAQSWLRPHGACRHARLVCRVPRVLCKWQACLSQQVLGSTQEQIQETD